MVFFDGLLLLPLLDIFWAETRDPNGISSSFWSSAVVDDRELESPPEIATEGCFLDALVKGSFHRDLLFSAVLSAHIPVVSVGERGDDRSLGAWLGFRISVKLWANGAGLVKWGGLLGWE